MNKWTNEQINKWTNKQMNKWTNEQMNKWTNEQMNKWTNEQTDGYTHSMTLFLLTDVFWTSVKIIDSELKFQQCILINISIMYLSIMFQKVDFVIYVMLQ